MDHFLTSQYLHSYGCTTLFNIRNQPNKHNQPNQLKRHNQVCVSLHSMVLSFLLSKLKHVHQIHAYNSRHCDLLCLPLTKTFKYQGSFRYNGACTFTQYSVSAVCGSYGDIKSNLSISQLLICQLSNYM